MAIPEGKPSSSTVSGRLAGSSGYLRATGSPTIDDLVSPRGYGYGKCGGSAEGAAIAEERVVPVALAVREAGGQEAEEPVGGGLVGRCSGRCPKRCFGRAQGWLDAG